eukprot:3944617-Alexandrium_andersonii.AAC.2
MVRTLTESGDQGSEPGFGINTLAPWHSARGQLQPASIACSNWHARRKAAEPSKDHSLGVQLSGPAA